MYDVGVLALSGTSCCLSIIGGCLIFLTYARIPAIRNYTRTLLMYLTIADMLTASGYLLSVARYAHQGDNIAINDDDDGSCGEEKDPLCRIQSFLTTFSSMASFFWTVVIAIHIHATVVYGSRHTERAGWLVLFHVVSWFIPGIITVAAVGYGVLGEDKESTGPWCWITSTSETVKTAWMFYSGKGWELLCYLATAVLYIHLKVFLRLEHRNAALSAVGQGHDLRDEDSNFMYVWLVLYLLRMWGTLRFFIFITVRSIDSAIVTKLLLYLHAAGDPGQAFANFLLFCVGDVTVRDYFRTLFRCHSEVVRYQHYVEIEGSQDTNTDNVTVQPSDGAESGADSGASLYESVTTNRSRRLSSVCSNDEAAGETDSPQRIPQDTNDTDSRQKQGQIFYYNGVLLHR